MMSVGTGGFSGSSAATGPVAGFDPLLDFRKKMARRIKDHPFAQDYKSKRKKSKKMKESVENPRPTPHLYQYKVSIPEVGETIIYASSQAELMMKLRLLVNPRYRGDITIGRIFPSEAGKFYNEKRMKAYRSIPEATEDPAAAAAKKQGAMMKKQAAQKQVQQKIAAEKKKIDEDIDNISERDEEDNDEIEDETASPKEEKKEKEKEKVKFDSFDVTNK